MQALRRLVNQPGDEANFRPIEKLIRDGGSGARRMSDNINEKLYKVQTTKSDMNPIMRI